MASFLPRTAPRALFFTARAAARPQLHAQRPIAPLFRARGLAIPAEQPRLRLGSVAPNFQAKTTHGDIDFHEFIDKSWAVLFSHPADFTPVCTTELGAFAKLKDEFEKRGVKMIGLSANDLSSHSKWVDDINDISSTSVSFPIIADADRHVAFLYDMISADDLARLEKEGGIAFTIRAVFIIDPAKKIRLTMLYPASTGRNTSEVLRVIDSLQVGDQRGVVTPIDWQVGEDVIVPPSVSTADAKSKFGEGNVREVRKYLRFTNVGK
ncbi:AhpC/TSA family thioredoxin peroxidase [Lophiostoma macrostomum CBS 122681]|uniref:AhpC/TSA family thioredoxin peroxidase n=1 Tax=Lophiostoma macrostomum CBS 122681 TaxID=1314788 RepID=A0A6A6STH2_9PLEO|nr:AhpC/TSA family thioredoxin peroxidase [Lophiostoma macrostomum CBS 122681]